AVAASYPARPVTIVSAFPPGGIVDVIARQLAQQFSERLGQNFIVENRTGAAGSIGYAYVARAKADGYTLVLAGGPTTMAPPSESNPQGWDPLNSFSAIGMIGTIPQAIIVLRQAPQPGRSGDVGRLDRNACTRQSGLLGLRRICHHHRGISARTHGDSPYAPNLLCLLPRAFDSDLRALLSAQALMRNRALSGRSSPHFNLKASSEDANWSVHRPCDRFRGQVGWRLCHHGSIEQCRPIDAIVRLLPLLFG
ncbi:MAG TPA: tripartite tricarboxylate transporter substrate-binding protein, partial [Stenotrophobium sp.]|nr:tripartite tricarboxylate transporter substrate-binding protein [Stenotrophobium sp.]